MDSIAISQPFAVPFTSTGSQASTITYHEDKRSDHASNNANDATRSPVSGESANQASSNASHPSDLSEDSRFEAQQETEKLAILRQLSARDREVRAHEQAHMAAGGAYITNGANYEFQRGADGRQYAVGGEVGIDTSPVHGEPMATLQKAMTIARAALAPANPSSQDHAVAAQAQQMANEARMELQKIQKETIESTLTGDETSEDNGVASVEDRSPNTLSPKEATGSFRATLYRSEMDENSPLNAETIRSHYRMQFDLRLVLQ